MFKYIPSIHFKMPKKIHNILSGLASLLLLFSTTLIGLSLATDHWRENSNIGGNNTYIMQGLVQECDKMNYSMKCIQLKNSKYMYGLLGALEIIYGLLIEVVVCGTLALMTSIVASFHRRSILVTPVVAMEITIVILSTMAITCYTVYFINKSWEPGWSYFLIWTALISATLTVVLHLLAQNVRFLGKTICT